MEFIKTLNTKNSKRGLGFAKLSNGQIDICLTCEKKKIINVGLINDGIGVELKDSETAAKTPYVQAHRLYDETDIPANLQSEGYKFKIPANQISENEYVFMFKDAVMM